jgi:hypothetical protein
MENLNQLQKDYLRGQLGRVKFVDLAAAAGCTLGQVREFATVVFEERKKRESDMWARVEAEQQALARRHFEDSVKLTGKTETELRAQFEATVDQDDLRRNLYAQLETDNREFLMDQMEEQLEAKTSEDVREQLEEYKEERSKSG